MNEKEAYGIIAGRFGINPDIIPFWVEVHLEQAIINPILPETVRRLGKVLDLRPGGRILDLACGKGGMTLPLVHTYKVHLTGVDLMPDFIREAWSRAEYSGLYHLCDFRLGEAARFAAQAKSQWDAVLVIGALPYIWDSLETGLDAVKPLVRPGGHMVIGLPYLLPEGSQDPEDPQITKGEMTLKMEKAGRVVEIFDDGQDGWDAYLKPQDKPIRLLKEKNPDKKELIAFLDEWAKRGEWEKNNLGYAVWVIQTAE